ncbi:hypothetical protein KJ657_03645, partial [Patescibacteria group bacterium]|nr:hypothetical protein [Patescibacteria group bacterium]
NAGSIETTFVSVSPSVDHDVTCPAIAGLAPPNDIHIPSGTLQPGDNIVQCIYAPLATAAEILIQTEAEDDADLTAPITLSINGTDYSVGSTVSSNPALPATLSLWIDSADTNIIKYGDMTPTYINPADDPVNVTPGSSWQDPNPANIYTGTYTLPAAAGANLTFHLRELDPDNGPVINTNVTVNAATQQSDSNGDTTFTGVAVNQAIDVTFGNHPLGPGAYTTPIPVSFLAGELTDGQNYDFTIYYVPVASSVTLDVQTLDEATQLINVNGAISLIVNGSQPALYGYGTAAIVVSNDSQYSYQIDWGPTDPASQYIEPAIDPVAVDVSALSGGAHLAVDGLYRVCSSGNCEVVTITAWDETGLAILNSVSITLNSVVVGNGQHIGTYDVGAVLNIEFEDVPTHGIPEVRVNGVNIGNIHTTQYTVLDAPSPNTVDAYYALDGNSVGFNVGTRDNQDNPLTENITHGITGTETTEPTPAFFAVVQTDLVNYIINFADRPGYITPGSITVQNQAIATVPSSVLITNNGVPYVAGTQLVIGDTYDIVATYTPYFVIEKNITNEQVIFDNDKRVDYQIVVTRHPDTAPGSMNIDLHDTIADSNRTLTGSNGGTMTVVPQNGDYSICSNGCGDITAGPVNVAIDNPGNSVTITYQLLSDNTGIPASQSSDFINTLTGTFDDGGTPVVINTDATVNVLAAPGGGESGGTPGGGGGGGGGALMIKGDMILEVTKLVSLNNSNFIDASDPDKPLSISERVDSTLFTKVKVKNLGQVTATNIKYSEGFDSGDSKITTDDIQNVKGDTGVSFDDASNTITIDKLIVGAEVNFSYEQILHESGSKGKLAEEYLTLEGFSTKLTANQDGLTKHGIGDHYPSWLVAGGTTVVTSTGSPLQLSIQTDKAAARIGEEVNYTIIAKNNADFDFTGLVITWDYDENALEVLNPFGGRNTGTELHWSSGTLKPGQTVKYELRSRVKDTAPVGSNVRTTVRGLVNEIENPAVAEQYLTIIAGVSAGAVKLAQTGMPTFTLILASLLAYLVYTRTGRRRYLALKKAALRPL